MNLCISSNKKERQENIADTQRDSCYSWKCEFVKMEADQGCTTPKNQECQIPAALVCPPPPRKKNERRTKREPQKIAYFLSPEIETFLGGAASST
ncbi:UNVERIFIED_CONTAM: hypothetical protein Sindi_1928500 [Sesamum indicum]